MTAKSMAKSILKNKIELLCPAGDLERLKTAVVFGADAVYCGLSDFSLRSARELNFTIETLQEGIDFAHSHGVKVYLTFNIFPHEWQMGEIEKKLKEIKKKLFQDKPRSRTSGSTPVYDFGVPDGIILSDLGMFSLVKKHLPGIEIHISTQANTLNIEAIKMWVEFGASRIVLARELTLGEIKEIKKGLEKIRTKPRRTTSGSTPRSDVGPSPVELEVFGHGAMCMAYSGRCLLSKYFTGREANLGECAQPCRWRYKLKRSVKCESQGPCPDLCQAQNDRQGRALTDTKQMFIEEETRPGDLVEIQEDENGTYFLNSKDLCVLDVLDQFIESGIDSLKIEGRTKSAFYVAVVTYVYRKAIDAYYEKQNKHINIKAYKQIIKELMAELNQIQNRGYWHGFFMGRHDYEQEYDTAAIRPTVIPLGQVIKSQISKIKSQKSEAAPSRYLVDVMNKFRVGEKLELLTPEGAYPIKIKKIKTEKGEELDEILKPKEKVWVEFKFSRGSTSGKVSERSFLRRKTK